MKSQSQPRFSWNAHTVFLLVILCVAAFLRWPHPTDSIWPDEALYSWCGIRLLEHPGLILSGEVTEYQPPLFSSVIAVSSLLIPPDIAPRVVPALFGILGIALTYWLGICLKNQFAGLLAAILLVFNPFHRMLSQRILSDVPLATLITLLVICLCKYNLTRKRKWGVISGVVAGLAVWMKWSGALGILLMVAYFVVTGMKREGRFGLKVPLLPVSASVLLSLPLIFNSYVKFGTILPQLPALRGEFSTGPPWFYIRNMDWLLSWHILLFVLVGLLLAFKSPGEAKWLFLSWFTLFLAAVSWAGEKDPRYLLPALPPLFLLSGIGVDWFVARIRGKRLRVLVKWGTLGLILLLSLRPYQQGTSMLERAARGYTGYKQAGRWLAEYAGADALVYAGSPRAVRLFSGLNYEGYGGPIRRLPDSREELAAALVDEKRPVFLEVDIWNWGQPEWAHPLTTETMNWLPGLGLELQFVHRVELSSGKGVMTPAVVVFKKG